jgi:hypothetical protein
MVVNVGIVVFVMWLSVVFSELVKDGTRVWVAWVSDFGGIVSGVSEGHDVFNGKQGTESDTVMNVFSLWVGGPEVVEDTMGVLPSATIT